jgi:branched-chain amino acid transport system substrate-binding protein
MCSIRNLLVAAVVGIAANVTAAQAEIRVAVAGPMSGQYSWFGEQMQWGAELAVEDLNAAGGVRPVTLATRFRAV